MLRVKFVGVVGSSSFIEVRILDVGCNLVVWGEVERSVEGVG